MRKLVWKIKQIISKIKVKRHLKDIGKKILWGKINVIIVIATATVKKTVVTVIARIANVNNRKVLSLTTLENVRFVNE